MNKKIFTASDLEHFTYLSAPAISPDGKTAAFVLSAAETASGEFHSRIQLSDLQGEIRLTLTCAKAPAFAADNTLYLLSDRHVSGIFQICHLEEDDILTTLSSFRHGVEQFELSPNGRQALALVRVYPGEDADGSLYKAMTAEEKTAFEADLDMKPMEITEIDYKNDDCYGVRDGSHLRPVLFDLIDKQAFLLDDQAMECAGLTWALDGSQIAYYGRPHRGTEASRWELFVRDMTTGLIRQVPRAKETFYSGSCRPVFSKDNTSLFVPVWHFAENGGFVETIDSILLKDGRATHLFDLSDESVTAGVNAAAVSRTVYGNVNPFFRLDTQNSLLYFRNVTRGWESLYTLNIETQVVTPVLDTRAEFCSSKNLPDTWLNVHDFTLPADNQLLFVGGNLSAPADLFVFDMTANTIRRLTNTNSWLEEYDLAETVLATIPTADGKEKINVWTVLPPKSVRNSLRSDNEALPMVLHIHGGPECACVSDFWHEYQAMAGAGILVVYTNPRGSSGYGSAFCNESLAWGKEAVDDLMLAARYAAQTFGGDLNRLGVTGGSYGGYMTIKLISQTKFFKAAVAQRPLANTATSYGTGDMGFASRGKTPEEIRSIRMLDFLMKRARTTLIRNVDEIDTPLLLLHGYKDLRCSFEQSEQMFIAMKERRPEIPVKLVMFPKANHGVTRIGNLYDQITHLSEMTAWFARYLPDDNVNSNKKEPVTEVITAAEANQ